MDGPMARYNPITDSKETQTDTTFDPTGPNSVIESNARNVTTRVITKVTASIIISKEFISFTSLCLVPQWTGQQQLGQKDDHKDQTNQCLPLEVQIKTLPEIRIHRSHQHLNQRLSNPPQGNQPPNSSPRQKDMHPHKKHHNIKTQANEIQQTKQWIQYDHGKLS